ncbi:MAG: zinc-binding alcohol dehydrogenase [Dehalococcoidia bacterium]|nr:zinc-binding alcohol dehydrogenase [Dehalococcoidia bacterium]
MKGRVAVCKEHSKPFVIEEYEVPALEPGAILLEMKQAGICGSDLHYWRGDQTNVELPKTGRVMGHEGFGTVHSLGKGANRDSLGKSLREGDRIVYTAIFACNHCRMCLKGMENLCINRPLPAAGDHPYFTGTFGDFLYLPPLHPVFKAPDSLPDEVLAPINCATGTVTHGLISAGATQGQTIVIMGAGGLGLTATAVAKDMGADQVIVLDRLENRLQLALEFGADAVINIEIYDTIESRLEKVKALTKEKGADIVIELVGKPDLVTEGIPMLDNGGTFLEIGDIVKGGKAEIDPSLLLMGKRIIGSLMYPAHLIPKMMDFLERNLETRPFARLVSHKFSLSDINHAFSEAEWNSRKTEVTRAVLIP